MNDELMKRLIAVPSSHMKQYLESDTTMLAGWLAVSRKGLFQFLASCSRKATLIQTTFKLLIPKPDILSGPRQAARRNLILCAFEKLCQLKINFYKSVPRI